MKKLFAKIIYEKGYLLLSAAWLYTISFMITNYWVYNSTPGKVQEKMEAQIREREYLFYGLSQDTTILYDIINPNAQQEAIQLRKWPIGIFVYKNQGNGDYIPVFWNTSSMQVSKDNLRLHPGNYIVNYYNGTFELIRRDVQYNNVHYNLYALIPVFWRYFEENDYLKNHFDGFPRMTDRYVLANTGYPIRSSNGQVLYHINERKALDLNFRNDNVALVLNVVSLLFLSIFLMGLILIIADRYGNDYGLGSIIVIISIVRLMLSFNIFPFNIRSSELFDPIIYASSTINPSLGDLLINVYVSVWFISFLKYKYRIWSLAAFKNIVRRYPYLSTFLSTCAWLLLTLLLASILKSIISDSQISFDVVNIFSLNVYTVVGLVIIGFIGLLFYNIGYLFLTPLLIARHHVVIQVAAVFLNGIILVPLFSHPDEVQLNCIIVLWLSAIVWIMNYRQSDIPLAVYQHSFFLFWITLLSLSMAALLLRESMQKNLLQEKSIAQKINLQTEYNNNSLLQLSLNNITTAFLKIPFAKLYNEYENKYLKDSILNESFTDYYNKYNTTFYTYDSSRKAIYNENKESYADLETIISNYSSTTNIENLYFIDNHNKSYTYIYKQTVLDKKNHYPIGYFFLLIKQKNALNNSPYYELFTGAGNKSIYEPDNKFAFAIYNKNNLVRSWNTYPFADRITANKSFFPQFEVVQNGKNTELWFYPEKNKTIIVSNSQNLAIEFVSLFSYIFVAFLGIVLFILVISFVQRTGLRRENMRGTFNINFTTQIQLTIIAISLFSFIVIGVSVISYFINNFNKSNQDKLSIVMHTFGREAEMALSDISSFEEIIKPATENGLQANSKIKKDIFSIAQANNIDLNIFDTIGQLRFSTQSSLYDKEILSNQMDPLAYYNLRHKHRIEYLQNENIGTYAYMSIYQPIYSNNGDNLGYLNIPYLNSHNEVQEEIASILLTMVNLMVFIFILAGAFSLQLTQRITNSFDIIIQKMRDINIGKQNEEIVWHNKDEIGSLVKEYNVMVRKLYKSAVTLAKNEREGAWQEMARQVAHEIKNPLTPMKLSIQYLQRAVKNNGSNIQELTTRVTNTLVEQIDQLAAIASDFSQFANINQVHSERIDLYDSLQKLAIMYSSDSNLDIKVINQATETHILADKMQINRLFTNLIKNAIEASEGKIPAKIDIEIKNQNLKIIVAVKDYGSGIAKDELGKIFTPNFTTKSSGTGLGLAICKGICLNADGDIAAQSQEGEGATFTVTLPLDGKNVTG